MKDRLVLLVMAAVVALSSCGGAKTAPPVAVKREKVSMAPPVQIITETVTIPSGALLHVKTGSALSTTLHNQGQRFTATLVEPLAAGTQTIAAKGAIVQGVVAEANPGGRMRGRASISLRLTSVEGVGGTVPVSTIPYTKEAAGTKANDAIKTGVEAASQSAGVVMANGAATADIGAESVLTFRLREPVTVTLSR